MPTFNFDDMMAELDSLTLNGNACQNNNTVETLVKKFFSQEQVNSILQVIQSKNGATTRGQYKKMIAETLAAAGAAAAAAAVDVEMGGDGSEVVEMDCAEGGKRSKKAKRGGASCQDKVSMSGGNHTKKHVVPKAKRGGAASNAGPTMDLTSNAVMQETSQNGAGKKKAKNAKKAPKAKKGGDALGDMLKPFGLKGGDALGDMLKPFGLKGGSTKLKMPELPPIAGGAKKAAKKPAAKKH